MNTIIALQPNKSAELFEPSVMYTTRFGSWTYNWISGQIKNNLWTPNDVVAKWKIKLK